MLSFLCYFPLWGHLCRSMTLSAQEEICGSGGSGGLNTCTGNYYQHYQIINIKIIGLIKIINKMIITIKIIVFNTCTGNCWICCRCFRCVHTRLFLFLQKCLLFCHLFSKELFNFHFFAPSRCCGWTSPCYHCSACPCCCLRRFYFFTHGFISNNCRNHFVMNQDP